MQLNRASKISAQRGGCKLGAQAAEMVVEEIINNQVVCRADGNEQIC